jgi:hydrocephalus-inducing protein
LLTLRNNDKVPRTVTIQSPNSTVFSVIPKAPVDRKIAAGMGASFTIKFAPDSDNDFNYDLICTTEREKFIVPMRTIGSRGVLEAPDDINFPKSPIKFASSKNVIVKGVGKRTAHFTLHTEAPFFVTPTSGSLAPDERMQLQATFVPQVYHIMNIIDICS